MKKKNQEETSRPDVQDVTDEERPAGESGEAGAEVGEERDRLQDQLKRAMADLQNIRRRHLREMEESRKRALEGLATELLPVLDNFELALAAHEQRDASAGDTDDPAMVEGVRMVRSLLQGVLERHGLAEIPALGEPFDPNVHEAVGVDGDASVPPGRVSKVMQQGYTMGGRVIRPSKVVVAGESRDGEPAEDQQGGDPDAQGESRGET